MREWLFHRFFKEKTTWHFPYINCFFLHLIFVKEPGGGEVGKWIEHISQAQLFQDWKQMVKLLTCIWRGRFWFQPWLRRGRQIMYIHSFWSSLPCCYRSRSVHQVILIPWKDEIFYWGQWTWIREPTYSSEALNPDDLGEMAETFRWTETLQDGFSWLNLWVWWLILLEGS